MALMDTSVLAKLLDASMNELRETAIDTDEVKDDGSYDVAGVSQRSMVLNNAGACVQKKLADDCDSVEISPKKKARRELGQNLEDICWLDEHRNEDISVMRVVMVSELGGPGVLSVNLDQQIDCAEFFSVPTINPVAEKKGLKTGLSFDITTGLNFLDEKKRKERLEWIKENKPGVVIVCPPCTMFSLWQRLNRKHTKKHDWDRRMIEARVLLAFGFDPIFSPNIL